MKMLMKSRYSSNAEYTARQLRLCSSGVLRYSCFIFCVS